MVCSISETTELTAIFSSWVNLSVLIPIVSRSHKLSNGDVIDALFCLCRGTNIYNSFWGVTEFQDTYHGFLYFLTFLSFSLWILYIAGARETQEDTL